MNLNQKVDKTLKGTLRYNKKTVTVSRHEKAVDLDSAFADGEDALGQAVAAPHGQLLQMLALTRQLESLFGNNSVSVGAVQAQTMAPFRPRRSGTTTGRPSAAPGCARSSAATQCRRQHPRC